MTTLAPLVNLLLLLTVLSMAAERAANIFKLNRPNLRTSQDSPALEKNREKQITWVAVAAGIAVAILVKANLFEILSHLDAPWDTLGWVQLHAGGWVRSPATTSASTVLYTLGGAVITGVALGFGSKFWHDILDIVFNTRERLKRAAKG